MDAVKLNFRLPDFFVLVPFIVSILVEGDVSGGEDTMIPFDGERLSFIGCGESGKEVGRGATGSGVPSLEIGVGDSDRVGMGIGIGEERCW